MMKREADQHRGHNYATYWVTLFASLLIGVGVGCDQYTATKFELEVAVIGQFKKHVDNRAYASISALSSPIMADTILTDNLLFTRRAFYEASKVTVTRVEGGGVAQRDLDLSLDPPKSWDESLKRWLRNVISGDVTWDEADSTRKIALARVSNRELVVELISQPDVTGGLEELVGSREGTILAFSENPTCLARFLSQLAALPKVQATADVDSLKRMIGSSLRGSINAKQGTKPAALVLYVGDLCADSLCAAPVLNRAVPADATVVLRVPTRFGLVVSHREPNRLSWRWELDGAVVSEGNGDSLLGDPGSLRPGRHRLRARVVDCGDTLYRLDHFWTIVVPEPVRCARESPRWQVTMPRGDTLYVRPGQPCVFKLQTHLGFDCSTFGWEVDGVHVSESGPQLSRIFVGGTHLVAVQAANRQYPSLLSDVRGWTVIVGEPDGCPRSRPLFTAIEPGQDTVEVAADELSVFQVQTDQASACVQHKWVQDQDVLQVTDGHLSRAFPAGVHRLTVVAGNKDYPDLVSIPRRWIVVAIALPRLREVTPSSEMVEVAAAIDSVVFRIDADYYDQTRLVYQWKLDGIGVVGSDSNTRGWVFSMREVGDHTISVKVADRSYPTKGPERVWHVLVKDIGGLAKEARRMGRWGECISRAQEALTRIPDLLSPARSDVFADLTATEAYCYCRNGEFDKGNEAYLKARPRLYGARLGTVLIMIGNGLYDAGMYDDTIRIMEEFRRVFPFEPGIACELWQQARLLHAQVYYAKATDERSEETRRRLLNRSKDICDEISRDRTCLPGSYTRGFQALRDSITARLQ